MNAAGVVSSACAGRVEVVLPGVTVGEGIRIRTASSHVHGEVGAVRGAHATIAPYGPVDGVRAGDHAVVDPDVLRMPLGTMLLGRSVTANGEPLDGGPPVRGVPGTIRCAPPSPSQRAPISAPLWTGVRTIDGLLTIGAGSRIGIFGPPGAGKSTLVDRLFRGCSADTIVVALVGERGREAEQWLREVASHACVICATSDRGAAERVRAAEVAMAQASALRARGLHVLLILDSLARYAGALREVGLANGELPGRGGFPASVFARLATYVENAGNTRDGCVTLIATVLSDGDERDPVSEAARSLLDGHIQLDIARAQSGKHPAIDVPASSSRTMSAIVSPEHLAAAAVLRAALAMLAETADARAVGIAPADANLARIVAHESTIDGFMTQGAQPDAPDETLVHLYDLVARLGEP